MQTIPVTVKLTLGELQAIQVLLDTKGADSVSHALVLGLGMLLNADPDTREMYQSTKHERDPYTRRRSRKVPLPKKGKS